MYVICYSEDDGEGAGPPGPEAARVLRGPGDGRGCAGGSASVPSTRGEQPRASAGGAHAAGRNAAGRRRRRADAVRPSCQSAASRARKALYVPQRVSRHRLLDPRWTQDSRQNG